MKRLAAIVFVALVAAACGGSQKLVRLTTDWPSAPSDYEDVTEQWTRSSAIRTMYQEVVELTAVFKSPDWRAAYAARDAEHRKLSGAAKTQRMAQAQAEMEGPWEMELLVTTWDRRENDLDLGKRSVWRVVLVDDAGNEIEPLEIVKDKRPAFVVRADYPAYGDFATAYIARFPRTANVLGPGVKQLRLRMSGSRGGVEVVWNSQ